MCRYHLTKYHKCGHTIRTAFFTHPNCSKQACNPFHCSSPSLEFSSTICDACRIAKEDNENSTSGEALFRDPYFLSWDLGEMQLRRDYEEQDWWTNHRPYISGAKLPDPPKPPPEKTKPRRKRKAGENPKPRRKTGPRQKPKPRGVEKPVLGPRKTHYSVLGVDGSADTAAIKKAYRRLVLHCHPDKMLGMEKGERAKRAIQFQEVQDAYEILVDGVRRMRYDMQASRRG